MRETGQTHGWILNKEETPLSSKKFPELQIKPREGASVIEAHPLPNPPALNARLEFLQLNNQRNGRLGGFYIPYIPV